MQPRKRHLLVLLFALLVPACGSTSEDGGSEVAPPPAPVHAGMWTREFLEPAFLVADEIMIQGPPALREHLVVRQDKRTSDYSAKTTEKGFLQQTVAKPDQGLIEIRAQLDAWQLVAFKRIVWLERPGDVNVTVRASGDAKWGTDAGESREGDMLEFVGDRQP